MEFYALHFTSKSVLMNVLQYGLQPGHVNPFRSTRSEYSESGIYVYPIDKSQKDGVLEQATSAGSVSVTLLLKLERSLDSLVPDPECGFKDLATALVNHSSIIVLGSIKPSEIVGISI